MGLFSFGMTLNRVLFLSKVLHCYGSETWDLSQNIANQFWKACGQAARRMLDLPPQCPSNVINTIYNMEISKTMVLKKCRNLIECFKVSENNKMQCVYANAMSDARSIIRCNLRVIDSEWGGLQLPQFSPVVSPEYTAISELLEVRQGL